jgi:PAS domain S-box-containing protein
LAATGEDLVQLTLLGEALEHLGVAVMVAQESGARVAVNQEACRLTGYTRDELLALPVERLTGRTPREHKRKQLDFAKRQRAPGKGPLRRKDGSIVDVEYRWVPTRVAGMDFYLFLVAPAGTLLFDGVGKRRR